MEVKKEVDEVSSMFSQDTTEVSQRKHEWCSDAILNKMREIESRYKKRIFSQFIYIRIFLHFMNSKWILRCSVLLRGRVDIDSSKTLLNPCLLVQYYSSHNC